MNDEPMLWTDVLASREVRDLIAYAQLWGTAHGWCDREELFENATKMESLSSDALDSAVLLGVLETRVEHGELLYRVNEEWNHLNWFHDHSYSVKVVNRKPTATCGGSDEEKVKWTTSPQKRSVLS